MRVIAGRFRGRSLQSPRGTATRPTTDRVREALFSLLGDLTDSRVLDLYAGSGALGIEALSRGASQVAFVEAARPAVACIRNNLAQLGVGPDGTVVAGRVERVRSRLEPMAPFNLVFCDPPWPQLEGAMVAATRLLDFVNRGGTFVVEHPARHEFGGIEPCLGQLFDRRTYGDTGLSFFHVGGPD